MPAPTLARRSLLAAALLPAAAAHAQAPAAAAAPRKLRLGQANPTLVFLPVAAARALGSFAAAGLDLDWSSPQGGDAACLAALDRGEIDFAAVGAETLLSAAAKGQPVQMIFALMSKLPLELVVSNAVIERTGVSRSDDPLPRRLAALKGLKIGVTAAGGTQERAARWLARQAGLDPAAGIEITVVGPPAEIQAALAAGRIDAYLLSPPEGLVSEDRRTGQVLIRMGDEFPPLAGAPGVVLAARTPLDADGKALAVSTCRALLSACTALLADSPGVASKIQAALYPELKPPVIAAAVARLKSGVEAGGRFEPAGIATLTAYAADTPTTPFWTNAYWDDAAKP